MVHHIRMWVKGGSHITVRVSKYQNTSKNYYLESIYKYLDLKKYKNSIKTPSKYLMCKAKKKKTQKWQVHIIVVLNNSNEYHFFVLLHSHFCPSGVLSDCSPSRLSDQAQAAHWGWSDTCSTRWRLGTPAGQSWFQMYANAERQRRRKRTETQSHSLTAPRAAAGVAKAPRESLCCCDGQPMSCCSEPEPRWLSFSQSTRALVPTCKQSPRQTCKSPYN